MDSDRNSLPTWQIKLTEEAKSDLDDFIYYLLVEKMSEQAAQAVLDDAYETIDKLAEVAGSLQLMEDPYFSELGYRKIRFQRHNYYFVYRVVDHIAIVDRMFHDLQDIDKALK